MQGRDLSTLGPLMGTSITSSSINIGDFRPPVVADLAKRSVQFDPFLVRADSKMLGAAGEA